MGKASLQARFIVPVSVFVFVLLLGGSLVFSGAESARIEGEVAAEAERQVDGVLKILGVTDVLVMQQVEGSMRLLTERGAALGSATPGPATQVKDRTVPNLLLGGKPQANAFELVDGVTRVVGGTATLFVKSGDDFVRISTNVKRNDQRAIGTVLDPKGKAIAAIREGKAYYGLVDILGEPYLTGYEPLRDAPGNVIGIWYVGYKVDMAALKDVVGRSRLLGSGFLAIVDGHGKARFHPERVTAEQVEKFAKEGAAGWKVARHPYDRWGFGVIAAYPEAEVSEITRGRAATIVVVGVIGSLVVIVLIGVLLGRLVLRPRGGEPEAAAGAARRIAGGDLTAGVPVRAGDTASLMAAVATMQDQLKAMVRSIQQSATAVVASAHAVSDMSGRIATGSARQSDATTSIAATLEQVTVSITHIADGAESASRMSEEAGSFSREGDQVVGQVVGEMQRSADAVNQSAQQVEQLGESSRAISAIVNVIKEIADQTNLLALNAAIEAARAGEAGRGFAVVADEVRKLAERTGQSTHEITGMIGDIQRRTGDAIEGIAGGTRLVNASVGKAALAGSSMSRIETATRQLGGVVADISNALREQRVASEDIARSVDQVARVNEENSAAVLQMAEQARQLEALAEQLQAAVGTFRL